MKDQFYHIISNLAIFCYFIPLLIVSWKNLWRDAFFMLFAAYWMIGGFLNVNEMVHVMNANTRFLTGVIYNMLDIPLVLIIFYFTTNSIFVKQFTRFSVLAFIIIETLNIFLNGSGHLKYILGLGLILVLVVITWEVIRYLQKMVHSNRQNAMTCMYASLLFKYGMFVVIYFFNYFIPGTDAQDNYLIYYVSSVVAIGIAASGYLVLRKKPNVPRSEKIVVRDEFKFLE